MKNPKLYLNSVEDVKQSKRNLNMTIFLLNLSLKIKLLMLSLNYQQIKLVCLMTTR